ncbi:MAG: MFS transporter [Phycisphaerales bacterium]|nr:MFS transporter [Planctomycetota bacterium]MCH8509575.1 MFS transporter [Phycisphaerales bacterium]
MTTVPVPDVPAQPLERAGGVTRPRLRAWATVLIHGVNDAFSFMIIALLPLLVVMHGMTARQKALLLGVGSVASGLIQPLVAWLSDRWDTRVLGTLGLLVAVLAVSNVGMAQNAWQLALIFAIGAAGIGAFHPPSAAAVGRLAGPRRSRYLALFFLFGMLGGMVGNVFTPRFVEAAARAGDGPADMARGLDALRWMMIPGLICVVLLACSIHRVAHKSGGSGASAVSWERRELRARWGAVAVLYLSNMLRFTVNMALVYLFSEWAERQTLRRAGAAEMTEILGARASELNGLLQGAMQVGMGGGGLILGFVLAARFEKTVFWVIPTLGAVAIAGLAWTDAVPIALAAPVALTGSVLAGAGFGACVPISMGLAQRMLPHRTSLASGLMLGGAWAFAFAGPMAAEWVQYGLMGGLGLSAAFLATAGALFVAGLITLALPRELMARTHRD